ncbi:type II CAAX endopeptidase family protein [uncultured Brevundimonas sp.]|uniref:CPBP family intramembrane glutamic endopeptidase n=1 Tax=uncultured Brevundimonas sp. TaxID=213418 RepID=UPI0030EF2E35
MDAAQTVAPKSHVAPGRKGAKGRVAIDISLVLGTLLIVKYGLLGVEAMWTYAGPISLLSALAVATWRLRGAGETWAELGLGRPDSWGRTALWTLLALGLTTVAGIVLEGVVSSVLEASANQPVRSNSGRFANVPGNTLVFVYWLAVAWIVGAMAEEMLFRAFLITRLERLLSRIPFGLMFAVVLPAILFGQQHFYYQGIGGAVATGGAALVSGVLYLLCKRNLWPLSLSHGLVNSIGLTLIYTGLQAPG